MRAPIVLIFLALAGCTDPGIGAGLAGLAKLERADAAQCRAMAPLAPAVKPALELQAQGLEARAAALEAYSRVLLGNPASPVSVRSGPVSPAPATILAPSATPGP